MGSNLRRSITMLHFMSIAAMPTDMTNPFLVRHTEEPVDDRPQFSEEELEKLSTLSGKEKRAYVKELKAKYAKKL